MSKKRALILGLVLLPLAVGGGIIASLANGTRSLDVTGLEAPANAGDVPNTAQETPAATSPRIEPASISAPSEETLTPMQNTPARQAPNSAGETITIDSDQATSEPLFASTAFTPAQEGDELPAMDTFGRSALYTLAGRAHGGGGGGGAGGTTEPSGNTETGASPDNSTSKNPTGSNEEASSDPSSDSDEPANEGSNNDEQSETKDEGEDEPTGEDPPPVFFPPTDEPSKPVQVPEPASLALLGLGLLGCALARRKTVK